MKNYELIADFLVNSRKKAGLTQQDVATRSSNISSQKMVSRIEASPLDFQLDILLDFITATGANRKIFAELISSKQYPIERNEKMIKISSVQKNIEDFIKSLDESIKSLNSLSNEFRPNKLIEKLKLAIRDLSSHNDTPILAIMGPSDSGKSHIINMLLKEDIAPEGFQPMTAASTLFIHEDQKPSNLQEQVIVFKYEHNGKKFSLDLLHSNYEEYVLDKGSPDILSIYGARDEDDNIKYPETYLAVVYVNSPVLKKVSLLDTPGQLIDPDFIRAENDELDSLDIRKAYEAMGLADAILFTSSITKFLRDGEPAFFANILRAPGNAPLNPKAPLNNITILATQAFPIKNIKDFHDAANRASKNFHKEMSHFLYEDWQESCKGIVLPTAEDWANRMLPFLSENEELLDEFYIRFDQLVKNTIETIDERREKRLSMMRSIIIADLDIEIATIEDKRSSNTERAEEISKQDARFRGAVSGVLVKFNHLKQSISKFKDNSISGIHSIFSSLENEDFLYDFISERFDDKSSAKKGISGAIGQYIETRTKKIFNKNSRGFADQLDSLLMEYAEIVPGKTATIDNSFNNNEKINIDVSGFDVRSAFIGGLSGLTAFGAMGFYVSTITSNLGAYILVGQAAGVLTSLGLTGSVTTLPWLVSTTGGPVVWGAMIAAGIAYLVFRLFSDWKKSMAKSISKELGKGKILAKVEDKVNQYWDETSVAFEQALSALTSETDKYINTLYEDAQKNYKPSDLDYVIDIIQTVKEIIK